MNQRCHMQRNACDPLSLICHTGTRVLDRHCSQRHRVRGTHSTNVRYCMLNALALPDTNGVRAALSVVGDIIAAGVPRPVAMFLVLGGVVFVMTYLLLPLSMKVVRVSCAPAVCWLHRVPPGTHARMCCERQSQLRRAMTAPYTRTTTEPCRSLQEGLCCFSPNPEVRMAHPMMLTSSGWALLTQGAVFASRW